MAKAKKKRALSLDDEQYIRRAIAAWFRNGGFDQPSTSEVVKHAGKFYVVLRNSGGVMASYRIRNDEVLKRMKRYPKEIK